MIKQRHSRDCMLASTAMVLGLEYDEFLNKLPPELVEWVAEHGLYGQARIRLMFESHGLVMNQHYVCVLGVYDEIDASECFLSAARLRGLLWGRRALIQVASLNHEGENHVVAWLYDSLHDPSNKKTYETLEQCEPKFVWLFHEPEMLFHFSKGITA